MEWSRGEVTKPETINYRTLKPEKTVCSVRKSSDLAKTGNATVVNTKRSVIKVLCDRCGVEVTKATVRRERMGHIKLAAPVSHIWYFKGIPSRMGLILISLRELWRESCISLLISYLIRERQTSPYKQVLSEAEYQEAKRENWSNGFRVGMGAESIKELLESIDLEKEYAELQAGLENALQDRNVQES